MKKKNLERKLFLCLVSLVFAGASMVAQQKHFTANGKKVNVAAFDSEVEKMLTETGVPAVSLAVIENNNIVYSNAYGFKQLPDKQPINKNTVFEACSLSKIYLVFIVHQLVGKGAFDLDKPMHQYLEYKPLAHDARYKLITPRMILSHTSGMENWRWYNNQDTLEIISDPGKKFVYSGEGFQYLAKVIESILKEPYESYVAKMVISPLKLNATYLKYSQDSPADYAMGYTNFNDEVEKWKNLTTVPASGVHTTGAEFAKLLVSMFNKKHLSNNRISDMLKPVIKIQPDNPWLYMGAGFSMICNANDTIVSFSGSNEGFKAELFYSTVNKRGFVFFTNSDRGNMIISRLSKLSAGFNLDFLFEGSFYKQYPSTAFHLLKIYREKNAEAMFEEVSRLQKSGQMDVNTLNELGDLFMSRNQEIAKRLLETNISMYPESALSYCLLGGVYYGMKDYALAYKNLVRARALNFNLWDIEGPLKECEQKVAAAEKKLP